MNEEIGAQGNKVRDLKSKKAEKAEIDAAVAILLDLKAKFKAETGQDWKPTSGGSGESKKNESKKGIEKCHENRYLKAKNSHFGEKNRHFNNIFEM